MPRKRKASSPVYTNRNHESRRKRWKETYILSSSEGEQEVNEIGGEEYPINCILDEDDTRYLIDWEGPWSPTWEPKECVNDVALEVWEETKRKRTAERKKQLSEIPQTLSQLSHSVSQGSGHPELPSARRQTEERQPAIRSASPLFIPSETVPEDQFSVTADHPLKKNPHSASATTNLAGPETSTQGRRPSFEAASPSTVPVFEYIPQSPIPAEYQLPGESAEPPAGLSTLSRDGNLEQPAASVNSRIVEATKLSGHNIRRPLPSEGQITDRKELVEIAETPSASPSETSRINFEEKESVSQVPSCFPDLRSNSSSITSLVYPLSSNTSWVHTGVGRLRSVPESIFLDTSQKSGNSDSYTALRGSVSQHLAINFFTRTMDPPSRSRETPSLAETMEKYSHVEGSTPREKMRNAYAQLRARQQTPKTLQTPGVSATPSSAEDIEYLAPAPAADKTAPLSVRADKEPASHIQGASRAGIHPTIAEPVIHPTQIENFDQSAVQTIQPSALAVSDVEKPHPGAVKLGPAEFAVPLPMDSRVKDDYDQVLTEEAQDIQEFLTSCDVSSQMRDEDRERLITKMDRITRQLNNITTHPDLNIATHIKDSEPDLEKEASWAEYSSAKFLFLGYIVELANNSDMHLIIMVQGGKGQQILECYLLGKGLVYTRPRETMGGGTNVELSMMKGSLSFGIQTTQNTGVLETYKRPSALIALDSTFNVRSPSVEHIRTTYAQHGNLLPVIYLLVANSSEHIGRCFPDSTGLERLRLLIRYILRLRDVVGDLQDDALGVHEDADEILCWLLSENPNASWPLPAIEALQITESAPQGPPLSQLSVAATPIQKRISDADGDQPTLKRQRMESSQCSSQLTESSKPFSQTWSRNLHTLEKNLVQMKNAHAAEIIKLQESLKDAQRRLREKDSTLESLQHRYESRTKEFHRIRRECDRLTELKNTSEQRIERQKEEITKLKDERTQLRHDLETARSSLKVDGGGVAELEHAREEIRRLEKENASLTRKADYEKNQAEYTREQYQTASTVAAQSGNEIRQLREENSELRRKVAGEVCRLKEINLKNDESVHLSRIAELEVLLVSREDLLSRKEAELREIRKNRPSTRSTSIQPRSPKLNANSRPSSPGFVSRGSNLRHSSEPGNNNSSS